MEKCDPLEPDDQKQFREDYRQTETEIQKNIAVYLSALVIATGWIFGPQSKPIVQLFLGNEGLNLFGFIVLIAINVVFTCFLTYKSVQVHEIMQFVTYLAPQDSPLLKWEGVAQESAKFVKTMVRETSIFFINIARSPWASILLMWSVGHYIWKPASTLTQQIQEVESHTLPLVSSAPKLQTPPNAKHRNKT